MPFSMDPLKLGDDDDRLQVNNVFNDVIDAVVAVVSALTSAELLTYQRRMRSVC